MGGLSGFAGPPISVWIKEMISFAKIQPEQL